MTYEIIPEHQAILLDTPDPQLVLQKVPAAFVMEGTVLGMPHDVDTVTRLAYLGIKVPSPLETYYQFPREHTLVPQPFAHQKETSGFFVTYPRSYCFSSIGVGKTLSAAWAADYLIEVGKARAVLIVSTLSSLERTWGDALYFHLKHRRFKVLHGSAEKRRRLLAEPAEFYIINYAGVAVIQPELAARTDIDVVVLDELAECGKKNTGLWKSLEALIYPAKRDPVPYVWGMTATPIPNSPMDAYPQAKLVTPASVPKYFTQWKNLVMNHQSTYTWTPREESTKIVFEAMRPAIRFTRDECLDLPPTIYSTRDVQLSPEQTKHYKAISKELYTEINGAKIAALNEGIKLGKLLQVACGSVYDTNGNSQVIDASNRIEVLMEIIEQCNERIIVYVPFTAVTTMLIRALNKHWNFVAVTGDTPKGERDIIFSQFQTKGAEIDIVAHPGTMAHSLTLTEASTIVWFAPVDSNRIYEQANGRITRAGQKYTANIIHLAGSAVERKMYKRLQERQTSQGLLLSMVEANESLI